VAGMTVREVLESSATQAAWGGAVVVDGIDGIGLPLPSGLDDFDLITDHLKLEHVGWRWVLSRTKPVSHRVSWMTEPPRSAVWP